MRHNAEYPRGYRVRHSGAWWRVEVQVSASDLPGTQGTHDVLLCVALDGPRKGAVKYIDMDQVGGLR